MGSSVTNSSRSDSEQTSSRCRFSYTCKVRCMLCVCLVLIGIAAMLVYFLLTKQLSIVKQQQVVALPKKSDWSPRCPSALASVKERFDCYPEHKNVSAEACEARGCCHLEVRDRELENETYEGSLEDVPVCVYPKNYGYENAGNAQLIQNGYEVPLQRLGAPSRYGEDVHLVYARVEMQTKYRLRIKFYDPETNRYEVPVPKIPVHLFEPSSSQREVYLYSVTYNTASVPFSLKVRRSTTDTVIFDTSASALILANQFLELTTFLPSFNIFGLADNILENNVQNFNWKTWTMFSSTQDRALNAGRHPMYLCIENDGNAHGVLLLNSNSMEVQLHPSPAITFRSIGGILDFFLFMGPTPEDVIHQYTEAIGRPMMPPYWSLGLHVGKPIYHSSRDMKKFLNAFIIKHIPVDSLILGSNTFKELLLKTENFWDFLNITSKMRDKNIHFLLSFEPTISKGVSSATDSDYNRGLQKEVFITDKWGLHPFEGKINGKVVLYPDYGKSSTIIWWIDVLNKLVADFDGVTFINNLPHNEEVDLQQRCSKDNLNNPPFIPNTSGKPLYFKRLCMDALQHWRDDTHTHYDLHNLYGHSLIMASDQALKFIDSSKRKLILSDSSFIGTGHFSGYWIRDIEYSWDGLKMTIPTLLQMGLLGIPYIGTSICPEIDESKLELCLRWIQMGIFYPFFQLYGSLKYIIDTKEHNKLFVYGIRNAVIRRYELLPYLYTLLYLSHTKGYPVIRPLFYEFPLDNETYPLLSQFMWGSALLVAPILEKDAKAIDLYLPSGHWYDFYTGAVFYSSGEWFTHSGGPFLDSKQPAVMYARAGYAIPLQKPSNTTAISRQNPMSLLVALNSSYEAEGLLFWDDGETQNSHLIGEYVLVEFHASDDSLLINGKLGKRVFMSNFYSAFIQQVRIMGLPKPPKRIIIDGSYILSRKQYHWNYDNKVLDLKYILIPLARQTRLHWVF